MPHAFRYCAFTPVLYVNALHSPTIPLTRTQQHAVADVPGPAGNRTWQAWITPALQAVRLSLLTPTENSVESNSQHEQFVHYDSGSATVSLVLWACLAAIVSTLFIFVLVMAWMYCGGSSHKSPGNESARTFIGSHRGMSARTHCHTARTVGTDHSWGGRSSFTGTESMSGESGMLESPRTTNTSIVQGQLPGLPLCPLLVVPDGTRLGCVVQNDVCRQRQELSFDVSAVSGRGGAPLFRARVSELGQDGPAIFIETLGGRDQLAYLSTEDLWRKSKCPVMGISRPWGLPYGTMQKGENGEYVVVRGQSPLLTFAGDYGSHSIKVMVPSGHTIATTLQTSPEEYQVHMQARTDAGLVILGLLAIDKCELDR